MKSEELKVKIIEAGRKAVEQLIKVAREDIIKPCLLYTSPSPRDGLLSRMPSSA